MSQQYDIVEEVPGFYRIMKIVPFRRTESVAFDFVPIRALPSINAIDRVMHQGGALSPGPVGDVKRPWYMHPHQDDNLVVLHGTRHVDIFTREQGIEHFVVGPDKIVKGKELLLDGPAMLVWPRRVFHRIRSEDEGSASLNFAVHYEGFDIRTNFNIYDLDTETGKVRLIREGHEDQVEDAARFMR